MSEAIENLATKLDVKPHDLENFLVCVAEEISIEDIDSDKKMIDAILKAQNKQQKIIGKMLNNPELFKALCFFTLESMQGE